MKISMLLFLVFSFTNLNTISAQFELGLSSGINISKLQFQNTTRVKEANFKPGLFLGLAPKYIISKKIKLSAELQYSLQQFGILSYRSDPFIEIKLSYLSIVPEIEYQLFDNFSFGTGLYFSSKVSDNVKYLFVSLYDYASTKSTDFGLTGKFKYTYKKIFGFVRCNFGLRNISTYDGYGQILGTIDAGLKNSNIQLGVGYRIG